MSRARTNLEPDEQLLLAGRPHPAALLGPLLRCLGLLLAAAFAVALLASSSAPHAVRLALDLIVLAVAARAALRFTRAVWQWDRTLFELTTRRVYLIAPRGAVRRARQTLLLAGIHSASVSHSFLGRLFGYGTLTLGDGPQGRDVRFVSDADRIAAAVRQAARHERGWRLTSSDRMSAASEARGSPAV
jgi:hypothetical protein